MIIEWKYFRALNKQNQKKIIELLNQNLNYLFDGDVSLKSNIVIDSDDIYFIKHQIHLDMCNLIRNQRSAC